MSNCCKDELELTWAAPENTFQCLLLILSISKTLTIPLYQIVPDTKVLENKLASLEDAIASDLKTLPTD